MKKSILVGAALGILGFGYFNSEITNKEKNEIHYSEQHIQSLKSNSRLRQIFSYPYRQFLRDYQAFRKEMPEVFREDTIYCTSRNDLTGLESEVLGTINRINTLDNLKLNNFDFSKNANVPDLELLASTLDNLLSPLHQEKRIIQLAPKSFLSGKYGPDTEGHHSPYFDKTKKRIIHKFEIMHTDILQGSIILAHEIGHSYCVQSPLMDEVAAKTIEQYFIHTLLAKHPELSPRIKPLNYYHGKDFSGQWKQAHDIIARLRQKGYSYPEIFSIAVNHTEEELKHIF
ncbi:hypothetical protein KY330_04685 [Candidatus Woesearchaeota archaeon]|nr:hypothetical protein [Candidatus Woesearchaeota archaeon]